MIPYTIHTDLSLLETLAEHIHNRQSVGRALAVTLDHIANRVGYFEEQSTVIQKNITSLYDQGEENFAHELEKAFAAAMAGSQAFKSHVEQVWDKWYENICNPE